MGSHYLGLWTLLLSERVTGIGRVADGMVQAVLDETSATALGAAMGSSPDVRRQSLPLHGLAHRLVTGDRAARAAVDRWASSSSMPGILHCHDPLQAAATFRHHYNVLRIYTVHSLVAEESGARGGSSNPARRAAIKGVLSKAEAKAVKSADVIHCLSDHVARLCRQRYPASNPVVLPFWVPVELARRSSNAHRDQAREPEMVLCVRRLEPRTGVDLAVEAWRRTPGLPTLSVVGTGSMERELRARVANAPTASRVEFLGQVDDERLVQLYRTATVNLMPTRAMEGFGLPLLEAGLQGCPTVGFAVGAIPEVTRKLRCPDEFLAPVADIEALVRCVQFARIWSDQERAELRERIMDEWTRASRFPPFAELMGLPM